MLVGQKEVRKILSLKPICENLEKKLNEKIKFFNDNIYKLSKKICLNIPKIK